MTRTAAPAHLGWRLLALAYDLLPQLALWFVGSAVLLFARGGVPVAPGSLAAAAELVLLWVVSGLYAVLSWRFGGQTLGMRPWRLRVVRADGGVPDWRQASLRYLAATLSLALFGLGFLAAALDRDRRAWHDRLSGTALVRLPRSPERSV